MLVLLLDVGIPGLGPMIEGLQFRTQGSGQGEVFFHFNKMKTALDCPIPAHGAYVGGCQNYGVLLG